MFSQIESAPITVPGPHVEPVYGNNIPAGNLNSMAKATWCELKDRVMASVKGTMLECLSPKHHDQWEFAAHKCFQLGFMKTWKAKKHDVEVTEDDSKYAELLRRVARLYVASSLDGAPREQLNSICAVVNTTVSMEVWNEVLKDAQRAMEAEQQLQQQQQQQQQQVQQQVQQQQQQQHGQGGSSASQPSSTYGGAFLPPQPVVQAAVGAQSLPQPHSQSVPVTLQQQQELLQKAQPQQPPVEVKWRWWHVSRDSAVYSSASASRLHDRECERRCKFYDSNRSISTAIRLLEEDQRRLSGESKVDGRSGERVVVDLTPAITPDPMALIVYNRLGFHTAELFVEKLDIMQKIVKSYRDAKTEDVKELLLGLISGSFTLGEVNRIVLSPEDREPHPGSKRNSALISTHRWTKIRRTVVGGTIAPTNFVEGVKKKKKRKAEERRRLKAESSTAALLPPPEPSPNPLS